MPATVKRPHLPRTGGRPLSPEDAWAYVDAAYGERRPKQPQQAEVEPAVEPPTARRGLRAKLRRDNN